MVFVFVLRQTWYKNEEFELVSKLSNNLLGGPPDIRHILFVGFFLMGAVGLMTTISSWHRVAPQF
jgi:hypothetical protein